MIFRFALPLAIAAAAVFSQPLAAQNAGATFERIDPDQELPAQDEAALTYAGLPPLAPEGDLEAEVQTQAAPEVPVRIVDPAPRGPAVREIAREVERPLPAPKPTPTPVARTGSDAFVIKSILLIEGTIRYGDWFWDESAAPRTGNLVITVDLDARVISAFRDGHEIGTAVALLGTKQHPTPLGTFPILTKEKDNVSEKYDNAPMPHTLRLTWDGIAIHGSPVLNGYASHGCVGVPDEFAAKLFAAASRGDRVIITRGKIVGVGDKVL